MMVDGIPVTGPSIFTGHYWFGPCNPEELWSTDGMAPLQALASILALLLCCVENSFEPQNGGFQLVMGEPH